jgi:hypothetical protein
MQCFVFIEEFFHLGGFPSAICGVAADQLADIDQGMY